MLLKGRTAVITGGARGIGKGIGLKFAEEGCAIVVADILPKEGKETTEEILQKGSKAIFAPCDVSDGSQIESMVNQAMKEFKRIDILVNNAGIAPMPMSIVEVSEEEWDKVFSINMKGVFQCCKAVVPYMKDAHYGKIINMSSMAAIAPPAPMTYYSASKAGLLGFTRDLALELAPFNICVNAILPGVIRTYLTDRLVPPGADAEAFYREFGKKIAPMERVGTTEDVAKAALFLASELSDYVTGDRVIVGGGLPLVKML